VTGVRTVAVIGAGIMGRGLPTLLPSAATATILEDLLPIRSAKPGANPRQSK